MSIGITAYNRSATGSKKVKIYTWDSVFDSTKKAIADNGYQFSDGRNLVQYPLEKSVTSSYFSGTNAPVFQDEFYKYITPAVRIRVDHSSWYNDFTNIASNYVLTGLTGSLGEVTLSDWQNSVSGPNRETRIGKAYACMIDMHTRYYNARGMSYDEPGIMFQNIFVSQSEWSTIYGSSSNFPTNLQSGSSTGPTAPWLSVYFHPNDSLSMSGVTFGMSSVDYENIKNTSLYINHGISGGAYAMNTIFSQMKTSIDERKVFTPEISYPKYVFNDNEMTITLLPGKKEYQSYDSVIVASISGWNFVQGSGTGNFNSYTPFSTFVYGFTNSNATSYVSQGYIRQIQFREDVVVWVPDTVYDNFEYIDINVFDPISGNIYRPSEAGGAYNTAAPSENEVFDDASFGYIYVDSSWPSYIQIAKNAAHSSEAAFRSSWTGASYISKSSTGSNKVKINNLDSTVKYYTRSPSQALIKSYTDSPNQELNSYSPYENTRLLNFSSAPYYWTITNSVTGDQYRYDDLKYSYLNKTSDIGSWVQHINDPKATTYKFFDKYTLFQLWGQTGNYIEGGKDSTLGCNFSPYQYTPEYSIYAKYPLTGNIQYTQTNVMYYYDPMRSSSVFDKNPYFFNFIQSLQNAHQIWLLNKVFSPAKTYFPNINISTDYSSSIGSKMYPEVSSKPSNIRYTLDILSGHTGPGYPDPSTTGVILFDSYGANIPMSISNNFSSNIDLAFRGLFASVTNAYNGISLTGCFKNGNIGSSQYTSLVSLISMIDGITSIYGEYGISGNFSITSYNSLTSSPKDDTNNIRDLLNFRFNSAIQVAKRYNDAVSYYEEYNNQPIIPWLTISESNEGGPLYTSNLFNSSSRNVMPVSTEYDTFNFIRTMIFDYNTEAFVLFKMPQLIYRVGATGVSGAIKMLERNDRFSRVQTTDYHSEYSSENVSDSHGRSPVAYFEANNTYGEPILETSYINLSLSEGGISGYEWRFTNSQDIINSTERNPIARYDSPGIYDTSLRIYNGYGEDTYGISGYIQVLNVTSPAQNLFSTNLNTSFITNKKIIDPYYDKFRIRK